MPTSTKAYAAPSATEPLVPFTFDSRDLRENDVAIDIKFCGVCHSDLHQARSEWGPSMYPLVPGHEVVGLVSAVGPKVTTVKVGDRAAVGCLVDSCRTCSSCESKNEQYCRKGVTFTYNSPDRVDGVPTAGGYADRITCREEFVLHLPANLDMAATAPLLCAGITTYSPLRKYNVTKGTKVAVVGLGGLGHMALKIAAALGAEVALFSRSVGKEKDAARLGATKVIISSDEDAMKAAAGQFDLIIDTVPNTHDFEPYVNTLAVNGTLVIVGLIGATPGPLNTGPLVFAGRAIAGSLIGGVKETQEMLDFCGKHNIVADIEKINIQDINTAFDRMQKSDVKYRFVIDNASLKQ